MKHLIIFAFYTLLNLHQVQSQNQIFVDGKSYSSTDNWNFSLADRSLGTENMKIRYAKIDKNSGYFLLSLKTSSSNNFSGSLFLFLEFDKVLTLNSLVSVDRLDGFTIGIYKVNPDNYKYLREQKIEKLRFTLRDESSETKENYSASNDDLYRGYDPILKSETLYFGVPTHEIIKQLEN